MSVSLSTSISGVRKDFCHPASLPLDPGLSELNAQHNLPPVNSSKEAHPAPSPGLQQSLPLWGSHRCCTHTGHELYMDLRFLLTTTRTQIDQLGVKNPNTFLGLGLLPSYTTQELAAKVSTRPHTRRTHSTSAAIVQ